MAELDRRAVIALIESIQVLGKTELKINFRYKVEYQAALKVLAKHKEIPGPLLVVFPALAGMQRETV